MVDAVDVQDVQDIQVLQFNNRRRVGGGVPAQQPENAQEEFVPAQRNRQSSEETAYRTLKQIGIAAVSGVVGGVVINSMLPLLTQASFLGFFAAASGVIGLGLLAVAAFYIASQAYSNYAEAGIDIAQGRDSGQAFNEANQRLREETIGFVATQNKE